jgi:hypothetical protein
MNLAAVRARHERQVRTIFCFVMRISKTFAGVLLFTVCLSTVRAGTTIDANNRYAYGANLGWLDCVADTNNGVAIGEYVCSGYLYSANVGWINLGSGSPANQIQYQNNSATDFGVNQDGLGNLTGYAYGANIGWITFEQTYGNPHVDLFTGKMSGYAWSANCGWISLSNSVAYVQTDSIRPAPLAPDGLPVAWLLQHFGTTNVNANADPDGDGQSNAQEYLAGTDPNNAASVFKITSISRSPGNTALTWNSVSTRYYAVQGNSAALGKGLWSDLLAPDLAGWSSTSFVDTTSTNRFYRVRAYRPLEP